MKAVKKPDAITVEKVVYDSKHNDELQREVARLREQLNQKDFQLKQVQLALQDKQTTKGYDVKMIEDFLTHLTWEVRIHHFEAVSPHRINPELKGMLRKFMTKYHACLLPCTDVTNEAGLPHEMVLRAMAYYRKASEGLMKKRLEALESLVELFEQALKCASWGVKNGKRGPMMPGRKIEAIDLLPPGEGGRTSDK
jgi:hypothetical protein